jgi:hypothetical protein
MKILLSFVVGGIWVSITTLSSEKFGSTVGGFLGGLPSTVVITMFFIAWTQGPERAFQATTAFPLAFAFNAVFLIIYSIFVRRGLVIGIAISIFIWSCLQGLLVISRIDSFLVSLIGWFLIFVISYLILVKSLRIKLYAKLPADTKYHQIVWRAIFSGSMIAFAVILSRFGGPLLGGIFAAFPSVYISTLIISYRVGGINFSRSLVTPLMISGLINCTVFITIFRYIIFYFPLIEATAIAYGLSIISAYGTYTLQKNMP